MCLYCKEENQDQEHFECEVCHQGMCDDCYDSDVEHDLHFQEVLENCEEDIEEELILKACNGIEPAYLCQNCFNKILRQGKSVNQLASVLQTYHTSSMGYRVWHNLNDKLECKTTYWGTEQQMLTYINYAKAVRVDHWIIDSQSWVTIWLTSMEFLSLKEGEAA